MIRSPTEEWVKPKYPGLMFCQTSTKEVSQTEPINNTTKKGKSIIMNVGDTILVAAAEAEINKKLVPSRQTVDMQHIHQ